MAPKHAKIDLLISKRSTWQDRELMIDGMMYHQNVFATAANDKDRICWKIPALRACFVVY